MMSLLSIFSGKNGADSEVEITIPVATIPIIHTGAELGCYTILALAYCWSVKKLLWHYEVVGVFPDVVLILKIQLHPILPQPISATHLGILLIGCRLQLCNPPFQRSILRLQCPVIGKWHIVISIYSLN